MPPTKNLWKMSSGNPFARFAEDYPLKHKKSKKLATRAKKVSKILGNPHPVVYLRKPEKDWPSEESKDDLNDEPEVEETEELMPQTIAKKMEKILRDPYQNANELGDIPSLTYNQKMTNWFVLNQTASEEQKNQRAEDRRYAISKLQKSKTRKSQLRERNNRLNLLEKPQNQFSVGTEQIDYVIQEERFEAEKTRHEEKMRKFARTHTPGIEAESSEEDKDVTYTRLFDGVENIKGDFEKAKRNMGVTQEPPTKEEIRQQRWDVVIRKHLQEKIEAGQKGYVDVSREHKTKFYSDLENPNGNLKENQIDIINGLRKSIREMSLKMAMTPPPDVPLNPNEYTVLELKCLLDLQSKGPVPKFTVGQLRKILVSLGFTRNVVNYNDFVDRLENVAMKKYGCSLHSKKLKSYLRRQSEKLTNYQEFQAMRKKASTDKIHMKIAVANQNISAFLKGGTSRTQESVTRRPMMELFPPTYTNTGVGMDQDPIARAYIPPKTYREKRRIRDADEFWKKYGKDEYEQPNWNEFRMDLEWKQRAGLTKGPGFPVQIKEKYPLIFGNDEAPVKLSSNFTTPDLIAALNRIIHHPMPLEQMMTSYEKKVSAYREKFPRLFRFEEKSPRYPIIEDEE